MSHLAAIRFHVSVWAACHNFKWSWTWVIVFPLDWCWTSTERGEGHSYIMTLTLYRLHTRLRLTVPIMKKSKQEILERIYDMYLTWNASVYVMRLARTVNW
jgi:hypothetical protein